MPGLDPCVTAPSDSQSSGGHAGHWSGQPTPARPLRGLSCCPALCSPSPGEGPAALDSFPTRAPGSARASRTDVVHLLVLLSTASSCRQGNDLCAEPGTWMSDKHLTEQTVVFRLPHHHQRALTLQTEKQLNSPTPGSLRPRTVHFQLKTWPLFLNPSFTRGHYRGQNETSDEWGFHHITTKLTRLYFYVSKRTEALTTLQPAQRDLRRRKTHQQVIRA